MLFNLYVSIHWERFTASRPQAAMRAATTKSYLNN